MRGRPLARCGEAAAVAFSLALAAAFSLASWHVVWHCGRCAIPTKEGASTV
jgi:hypothetical protein